jgi:hypothetical protein
MEQLITRLGKHLAGLIILTQLLACSPARYTYLKKVKIDNRTTALKEKQKPAETTKTEPVAITAINNKEELPDLNEVSLGENLNTTEEPVLLADKSNKAVTSVRRHIRRMLPNVEDLHAAKKPAKVKPVAEKTTQRKAYTEAPAKSYAAVDYDSNARHGIMWSLVAALLIVWLIGVMFANAGAFINVLLGVALILVLLNLLS